MYWTQAKMLLLADVDEYSFAKAEHQNFTPPPSNSLGFNSNPLASQKLDLELL